MKKYILYILLSSSCFLSCIQETPKTNHQSALPHTLETTDIELSEADKKKLAAANGKEVSPILIQDIEQMFDAAKEKYHIFSFWKLDCSTCIASLKTMTEALDSVDSDKYRLVFINMDEKSKLSEVNSFIREENIFAETYHLDINNKMQFDGIDKDWKGELPATFFVQDDKGVLVNVSTELNKATLLEMLSFSDE